MSSEYTIDIQLTELGFPEILQPKETPVEETPHLVASSSLSPSPSPPLLSDTSGVRQFVNKDQSEDPQATATQIIHAHQMVFGSTPTQTFLPPTLNPEDQHFASINCPVDAVKDSALPMPPQVLVSSPSNGVTPTTGAGITNTKEVERENIRGESKTENGQNIFNNEQKPKENETEVENESEETDDSEVEDEEEEEEEDDEEDLEGLDEESSGTGDYRCSICDLLLPSYFKLQDHMNLHTGVRPYCCAECGKRFCQIYNYRAHLRTHAQVKQTNLDPLRCRVCLKGFETEEGLTVHLSTSHFEKEFYECDLCKRIFTDLKVCEQHMEGHKRTLGDYVCETCGRHFAKKKFLNQHRQRVCQCSYSCTDCARIFKKKNALLKHSFSHLGLLPYTCVRCRRHFRLAKFYRTHKCEPARIHCVACLGVFLSQEDFQKHKKDTGCWGHQGSKGGEIRCMECGQSFASAEELKKHGGAHQRVLSCSECGKGFRSALLLMSHMGGHAGQRPCLCQSCGQGFPHQQAYDSHLKDCGRTSSANAPKKRPGPKSSSHSLPKKSKTQLVPKLPIHIASHPADAAVTIPAGVFNSPAVPGDGASSPSTQGVWKLALDKEPPAGVSLVMFVPVNSPLSTGLVAPSTNTLSLPVPDVQSQPCVALPPALKIGLHEATSYPSPVLGAPLHLDVPLDLAMGHKQEPDNVSPLDLSKKFTSPESALTLDPPVKSEPMQPDYSEAAASSEGEVFTMVDSKETILKTKRESGIGCLENASEWDRQLRTDPMDLSSLNVSETPLDLIMDIKMEPKSPSSDFDMLQPESCQLTQLKSEAEIKMEEEVEGHGDGASPTCADPVDKLFKEEGGLICGESVCL